MKNVPDIFGAKVFSDRVMKERLPAEVYRSLKNTIAGERLDPAIADVVAKEMGAWAVENGATHFTHWFQPMTGTTAEKHEGFIKRDGADGVIMDFSGKNLV
ncbi:MAG: glutamine synthetase III, partial [Clostridia bacterium]|nr:glutamine synthetase III [Clostridia bacterium]